MSSAVDYTASFGAAQLIDPEADFVDASGADFSYLDADGFDFDDPTLEHDFAGASEVMEHHEKRKNSDDEDVEENDAKRHETDGTERNGKKPGRKLLTTEPTSVSHDLDLPNTRLAL